MELDRQVSLSEPLEPLPEGEEAPVQDTFIGMTFSWIR
jgi:hypothetical protein